VSEVFAVSVLLLKIIVGVSVVGLVVEPYTIVPALLVISTSDVEVAVLEANTKVIDWITSVPESVWNVKVSDVVAVVPGRIVEDAVSVPVVNVVTLFGVTGASGDPSPIE
jgi:hypothetical protein